MNVLRNKQLGRSFVKWLAGTRHLSSKPHNRDPPTLILEPLVERQLVSVSGVEVISFLQGLTTNDMQMLESPSVPSIYTMFLNKSGRVMYDAIIYRTPDPLTVLVECDKEITQDLKRHLKLYLVRRKILVNNVENMAPWALFPNNGLNVTLPNVENMKNINVLLDPRLSELGYRILVPSDLTQAGLSSLFSDLSISVASSASAGFNNKEHRYSLGVAEGVKDLQPGKQFPLEANCDLLNGVSFNKGCYIGQELTARVHHTGVIRKRHMPVQLSSPLSEDSSKIVRTVDGTKVGIVLGSTAKRAICLLRVEQVLKCKEMFIDGLTCFTEKPSWWPPEVLSSVSKQSSA